MAERIIGNTCRRRFLDVDDEAPWNQESLSWMGIKRFADFLFDFREGAKYDRPRFRIQVPILLFPDAECRMLVTFLVEDFRTRSARVS